MSHIRQENSAAKPFVFHLFRGGERLMLSLGIVLGGLLIVATLGLAGVIAFGNSTPPPPLASIRYAMLKRDRTAPA